MKKMYKAVIVDDEQCAIDNLCTALKAYDYISVVKKAGNAADGIAAIENAHPDILFLDIELPDMSGMELISGIHDRLSWNMCIIFYTSHDKYVIKAFRTYAFDVLLKPFDAKELDTILNRFLESQANDSARNLNAKLPVPSSERPFMVVTPMGDLRFLHASEIGYFRYVSGRKIWEIALPDGTFLPLKRNTTAEQLCGYSSSFVQIHQSYIINMSYLVMVQDNRCIMYPPFNKEKALLVSKKYKKEMMGRFYQL